MTDRTRIVPPRRHRLAATPWMAMLIVASLAAADDYRLPPADVAAIVDAPPPPSLSIDPTGRVMILAQRASMPAIRDLAEPMLRLAGSRLNPATNGRFSTFYFTGYAIKPVDGAGDAQPVALPANVRLGMPSWSPDGARFAFTNTVDDGIELWVGDVENQSVKRLVGPRLNGAAGGAFTWLPNGHELVVKLVPEGRGPAPAPPAVPAGPVVQETSGRTAPVRTYQDLLKNPHDEAMFDHLMTSTVARLDVVTGRRVTIGGPGVYTGIRPAPDGRHLLVRQLVRPYSYLVTSRSFPTEVDVWDTDGTLVHHVASLPLRDDTPIEGVPVGPRGHGWMPHDGTAELTWTEALDGGDPKNEAAHRDRVMHLAAPFDGTPKEIARTEHRSSGMSWIEAHDGRTRRALLSEYDRDRRWTRTWLVDVADRAAAPRLIWDRSVRDRYGDPGRPRMRPTRAGRALVRVDGGEITLTGSGSSPKGDLPFLDRLNLATGETRRLWRCAEGTYESVVDLLEDGRVVTKFETPDEYPNYFVSDIERSTRTALTTFEDPAPQLRGIRKELVTYDRADGVQLSATLYLPADYQEGRRLPLLVWAYPRKFNDPRTAGQISGSPHRFTTISGSSHLFLLTQGYAIMNAATMPVIGDPETMNDTFLDQIVSSAQAAIDKAVEMGVADPERVGVGGHSYGAFMTANLLAHCDLFRAGVARSGAYNRTLTPFGFQSERRTLWEAPMSYFAISPFMHAHKVNEPILLIHGEVDNNSGTFPLQSRRMFHALKGHGATARLVMLPHESHGYRARESVMHVLSEMIDWFDTHVKYAPARAPARDAAPAETAGAAGE